MKRQIAAFGLLISLGCASAGASAIRDGGVIRNSGSTNFSGYTIKVWSDGSTWAVHSNRMGTATDTPVNGHVPASLAQRFLRDARQARNAGAQPSRSSCMKSVSFGTSTTVQYHGWTSPDLECPNAGFAAALAGDTRAIVGQLKLTGVPGHPIHLPRNEPRRAPSDAASGQASPTPEQSSPAS